MDGSGFLFGFLEARQLMNAMQGVLIFGATSAIAQAIARRLVARGCSVYAVGRNPDKLRALLDDLSVRAGPDQVVDVCSADLDRIEDHAEWFARAERALGAVDTVLIAHGTLPDQRDCESTVAAMLQQVHTNALSAMALAAEAANRLEPAGRGMIVAIGSVAGDRGRQSKYVYGSAKGMLAIFLQGLRNRLAPRGVRVLTVKPGFVATPMTAAFANKGLLWASPDRVARDIVNAMQKGRDVLYTPWFWKGIMWVIRCIPERVFKRLKL